MVQADLSSVNRIYILVLPGGNVSAGYETVVTTGEALGAFELILQASGSDTRVYIWGLVKTDYRPPPGSSEVLKWDSPPNKIPGEMRPHT